MYFVKGKREREQLHSDVIGMQKKNFENHRYYTWYTFFVLPIAKFIAYFVEKNVVNVYFEKH